jgi:hypothetical protein
VTSEPDVPKLQPTPPPLTNVRPEGNVSITSIGFTVVAVPRFVTTIVYIPFCAVMNGAVWRLSIVRSGEPITVAASASASFEGSRSPAIDTVAEFVTLGNAAEPTATVTRKRALSPAAIAPACVAVTIPPAAEMLQPTPTPLTNVSPAGSVSRTVTAPVVTAVPMFVTTSRYAAFWPTVSGAVCRLSSVTSAAPVIAVGSVSRSFAGYGSPATVTVAALTTAGNAAAADVHRRP